MRVAIDYTPAIRQSAGIGRYSRGLVDALTRIDRENEYLLFCAGEDPPRKAWPSNVRVRRSAIPSRWLTAAWYKMALPLPAEVLVGDCDLFHSPDFALPPLRRARGIVTVHDLSFMRLPDCADPRLRAYLEKTVPRAVSAAHRVLADSWNTREDLISLLEVPPERISVVPGAVDTTFAPVDDLARLAEASAKYKLPERFIISVGTLEPRKNYPRLISSYARLRETSGIPHRLVIVGKAGWLYDDIYERVRAEHVTDFVQFLGFVPDEDLAVLYSLADLMVFPTLYEGFGIPPLEAMACGTPVVSSNNSSLLESVGDAALTFDATETQAITSVMAQVLGDKELGSRLSQLGRTRAAQFTWEAAAKALLAAYRQAMDEEDNTA